VCIRGFPYVPEINPPLVIIIWSLGDVCTTVWPEIDHDVEQRISKKMQLEGNYKVHILS